MSFPSLVELFLILDAHPKELPPVSASGETGINQSPVLRDYRHTLEMEPGAGPVGVVTHHGEGSQLKRPVRRVVGGKPIQLLPAVNPPVPEVRPDRITENLTI